jgi:RNA polymerase sigma-70 factor (ECF subfamily)
MNREFENTGSRDTRLKYLDALYGYAMILTRNSAEAECLVQETYNRAIAPTESLFQGDSKIWFFTTLRNVWLSQLREAEGSVGAAEPSIRVPESFTTPRQKEKMKVREAIQQLPLRLREVICLRECQFSHEEIARLLNCTVEIVRLRVLHARFELRNMLDLRVQDHFVRFLRRYTRFHGFLFAKR